MSECIEKSPIQCSIPHLLSTTDYTFLDEDCQQTTQMSLSKQSFNIPNQSEKFSKAIEEPVFATPIPRNGEALKKYAKSNTYHSSIESDVSTVAYTNQTDSSECYSKQVLQISKTSHLQITTTKSDVRSIICYVLLLNIQRIYFCTLSTIKRVPWKYLCLILQLSLLSFIAIFYSELKSGNCWLESPKIITAKHNNIFYCKSTSIIGKIVNVPLADISPNKISMFSKLISFNLLEFAQSKIYKKSKNNAMANIEEKLNIYEKKNRIKEVLNTNLQSLELNDHSQEFQKRIINITNNVFVGIGYGLANVIIVNTSKGLVLIDTLENPNYLRLLLKDFFNLYFPNQIPPPIISIIYSHFHTDHVFGSSAALNPDGSTQVWAHELTAEYMKKVFSIVAGMTYQRSMKQFGSLLTNDEGYLNAGIGPKLHYSSIEAGSLTNIAKPTHIWSGLEKELIFGDTVFKLVLAPGETKDQVIIWLPQKKVLFGADNIYKTFPNIYAIRGTESRDALLWVKSLDKMREFKSEYLVLGHTAPLYGKQYIWDTLTVYRDSIQYVHDQTIRYMNKGYVVNDIVHMIQLPPSLKNHKFLKQFYGTVPWAVRAIFHHYVGWFSGLPQELDVYSNLDKAKRMANLVGGRTRLIELAVQNLENNDIKWALELIYHAGVLDPNCKLTRRLHVSILKYYAATQTSAPGRNWVLTSAKELEQRDLPSVARLWNFLPRFLQKKERQVHTLLKLSPEQRKQCIQNLKTVLESFQFLPVRIIAERSSNTDVAVAFNFTDTTEFSCIHLNNGVVHIAKKCERNPDIEVLTTDATWRKLILQEINPLVAVATGKLQVLGSNPHNYVKLKKFLALFEYME